MELAIVPQLPLGRYRTDFAIVARHGNHLKFVIVECDGAEFHDGVKEVFRDVERDVRMLAHPNVLEVVRLSGREIMRCPAAAAQIAATKFKQCWTKGNREYDSKFVEAE